MVQSPWATRLKRFALCVASAGLIAGTLGCNRNDDGSQDRDLLEAVLESQTSQEAYMRLNEKTALWPDDLNRRHRVKLHRLAAAPNDPVPLARDARGLAWTAFFASRDGEYWESRFDRAVQVAQTEDQISAMSSVGGCRALWVFLQHTRDSEVQSIGWRWFEVTVGQDLGSDSPSPRGSESGWDTPWGLLIPPVFGWDNRRKHYEYLTEKSIRVALADPAVAAESKWTFLGYLPAIRKDWVKLNAELRWQLSRRAAQGAWRDLAEASSVTDGTAVLRSHFPDYMLDHSPGSSWTDLRGHVIAALLAKPVSKGVAGKALMRWLSKEGRLCFSPYTYDVLDPTQALKEGLANWAAVYSEAKEMKRRVQKRGSRSRVYGEESG
jgi:hypothetical protein